MACLVSYCAYAWGTKGSYSVFTGGVADLAVAFDLVEAVRLGAGIAV